MSQLALGTLWEVKQSVISHSSDTLEVYKNTELQQSCSQVIIIRRRLQDHYNTSWQRTLLEQWNFVMTVTFGSGVGCVLEKNNSWYGKQVDLLWGSRKLVKYFWFGSRFVKYIFLANENRLFFVFCPCIPCIKKNIMHHQFFQKSLHTILVI